MEAALECRQLVLSYPRGEQVGPISLEVPRGVCAALIGPNGAGKSSLISMLLGLRPPTSGQAFLFGVETSAAEARIGTGYVQESVELPPNSRALSLLRVHASLCLGEESQAYQNPSGYLQEFGEGLAGKRLGAFSKGMRQRLALALAMLDARRLLILDEPNNGLDPAGIAMLRRKILELKKSGVTVLLSTHRLAEIPTLADLVFVMHKGKLVGSSSIDAFADLDALEDYFLKLTP